MSNSVSFITYGSETIALCAARPNWSENMKLDLVLPAFVTRAIIGKESRRAYATSQRYTFDHLFDSADLADSTDLRLFLNRLKTELVAAPLWTDQVTLSASCAIGATTLSKTALLPVRYGAEWLIVSDDSTQFEIVVVTGITTGAITLSSPGTQYAWPAGTHLYPLVFGRLKDRPEFTGDTDSHLSGRLVFKENSAFARKLNPRVVPASLVGSHIPDFSTYKLWTVRPHWSRMLDRTEADILIKQIGFGRAEKQYPQLNWNRRVLEMEFLCDNRDDVAAIEYFFNERKATTLPFFIPTFRSDLKLAANITAGATTFEIQLSRYEDAAYDDHPGSAFLAFVDRDARPGIYPQRITEVDLTTITPQVAIAEDHIVSATNVSFLMLVRLLEPKLSWSYDSDGVATCRLRFIEAPDEYYAAAPVINPPAFLYLFTEALPNGTTNSWYFTSYEDNIVFGGHTYTPAPFSHGRPHFELNLVNNKCDLNSWGGDFIANPLNRFLPYTLNANLNCTITRVNRDSPNDGTARVIFVGRVASIQMKGVEWKAGLRDPLARIMEQKFPRKLMQVGDNYIQFTPPTGLSAAAWKVTGTIATISGQTITVTGASNPLDWFSGGWIETGVTGNFELRSVLKSTVSGSTQTITIDRPFIHAIVGQSIDMYPGYDGTHEQCVSKFANNAGFGGYPYLPLDSPNFPSEEIQTPTGGKK